MFYRWLCIGLLILYAHTASAQWHTNWPISHLTGIPTTATYSNYMADLYHAADERLRATAYTTANMSYYTFSAGVFSYVTNETLLYYVPPFKWIPKVPWYIGVTNDASYTYSARYDQQYTNGVPYTNKIYALMTGSDGLTYTNLLSQSVVYTNGTWVTNTAYNLMHTNIVPYARWVTNDYPYNLFNADAYGLPGYDLSVFHDTVWTPPKSNYTLAVTSTQVVENAPSPTDPPVWGTVHSQVVTAVTGSVPYYLQTYISNGIPHYTTNYATLVGSNYAFKAYTGVVARLPTYTSNIVVDTAVYDVTVKVDYTNALRLMPDNFGYDMSGLMSNITVRLTNCAVHYGVTTNFSSGTLDSFLASAYTWLWIPGRSLWTNVPYNRLYYTGFLAEQAAPPLPKWTVIDWLQASGGGTNLYRKTADVDIDVYPDKTGPAYVYQTHGAFNKLTTDPAWTYGVYNAYYYTTNNVHVWTNVVDNPQFLTMSNQPMNIPLGNIVLTPLNESKVIANGFTNVFWCATTSSPPYKVSDDFSGADYVVTNLNWLNVLNNRTFTRQVYVKPGVVFVDPFDGAFYNIPYYDGSTPGTNLYIVPLVDGYDRFTSFDITWPGFNPYTFTVEVAVATWVVVQDLDYGKDLAWKWKTWFGTLANAVTKLHQLGYPTKVDDTRVGYKSLGPSGYYYPGGTVQATNYTVGAIVTLDRAVCRTAGELTVDTGATTAYPYVLDYMTWDTLTNWPATTVDISKAKADTIEIPSTVLSVTGNILRADSLGMPDGLYADYKDAANVTVTAPGQQFTLQYLSLLIPDSHRVDSSLSAWYASFIEDWVNTYAVYRNIPYQVPYAVYDWPREAVWNVKGVDVTNVYYTSGVGRSMTNSAGTVYAWPALVATNEVIHIPAGKCAANTKIAFSVNTNMALYANYSGMINPAAVDARYRAINLLKYFVFTPDVRSTYAAWTNAPAFDETRTYFGLDSTIYKSVENYFIDVLVTNFDISLPSYGSDTISGPDDLTVSELPEWSVYTNVWYTSGTGWIPISSAVDNLESEHFLNTDSTPPNTINTWDVTRDAVGWRNYFAQLHTYSNNDWTTLPYYATLEVHGGPAGRWAKRAVTRVAVDTNIDTSIQVYTGIGFNFGAILVPSGPALIDTISVNNQGSQISLISTQLMWTNTTVPAVSLDTNVIKRYNTFDIPGLLPGSSIVVTNLYDYAAVPIQISKHTFFTVSDTLTITDGTMSGSHSYNYSVKGYAPYSYKMWSTESVKSNAFKYHD